MVEAQSIFFGVELIAIVMTVIAVVYMIKIAKVTGWFKAWYILSAAFTLIVVRRILTLYAQYSGGSAVFSYINSTLLFTLSVLYIVGFRSLYELFKKERE